MPSTVNGIGTHYYGKTNHTARAAPCRSCNRFGNLESYDTRLWFVIVFIPVVPLGRKRIIDKCPACTRHYVMKADEYEQTKQLQVSGTLDQFRREPSADAAAAAHAQLLAFHEHQRATDFREAALSRFPDHAALRAKMAAQLREMASYQESASLYQEAFELDPELPEARVGVASRNLAEGNLDEADELLDFLTEPGEGQQHSLAPLDVLAAGFQRAGRHEDALRLAGVLMREIPKLEDNHAFRAFVRKSEKALGRRESVLPARKFTVAGLFRSEGSPYAPWQRKLAIGGVAAALLLGGLAVNNDHIRRHRTLYVLNATGKPANVRVDDQPAVAVGGMGRLTVSEGPHVVKVSGPVDETHGIALGSGYFDRWFSTPAWVYNVGGEAVLEDVTHVYSANGTPGHRRLLVGETFFQRPHVDYLFTAAPDRISVKNKNQEVIKTEISWAQADDFNAFMQAVGTDHKAAMVFAEKRLRRNPNQGELLTCFITRSTEDERGGIEAFLKSGLDRRPVDVQWHRTYQNLAELNKHEGGLVGLYDGFLAADPSDASLLYLRGRIDLDYGGGEAFYHRAIEADPKLGWPWLALAARASAEGRWDDCLKEALEARALKVNEPEQLAGLTHDARMAKGEAAALVDEYRGGAGANSQEVSTLLRLVDALAASGKVGEIDPAIAAWVARLPGPVQGQAAPHLRALGLYYAGSLKECAEFCNATALVKPTPAHLHALLALGRMKEATDDSVFGALWADPMNVLAVSVGFALDGNTEDSARWREKAVGVLDKVGGATEAGKAVKLLGATEPPSLKEVGRVTLPPEIKSVLLAALADKHPAERGAYLAEASRFNVSRKPPYYLIRGATEKAPGRP